jgi:hypothetical protein
MLLSKWGLVAGVLALDADAKQALSCILSLVQLLEAIRLFAREGQNSLNSRIDQAPKKLFEKWFEKLILHGRSPRKINFSTRL